MCVVLCFVLLLWFFIGEEGSGGGQVYGGMSGGIVMWVDKRDMRIFFFQGGDGSRSGQGNGGPACVFRTVVF